MSEVNEDFLRGVAAAIAHSDLAGHATTEEIIAAGGPDFCGEEEGSDEPPAWHRGYDFAVRYARRQVAA
jgi:hypothetical protein